jgi:hypothetical protein
MTETTPKDITPPARAPVTPDLVAWWCGHISPPLDEAACVRISALADIQVWRSAPRDRKARPRAIRDAIITLLQRSHEAEAHWRNKSETNPSPLIDEYLARIADLRRALMFRPNHDTEWLLEWDVKTHTRAADGQARYIANIIAREMRRAGHETLSDGRGAPLVKAVCNALPHFGYRGTLTAVSKDLRENRPPAGWGSEPF